MSDPPPGGVYVGPGVEVGCLIVPLVAAIGMVAGIVVALTATASDGMRVGPAAFVTGILSWVVLWEVFARLHPRFSTGRGDRIKWALVMAGPPVLAMAAAVATR
jgi:hypothetical protein